MTLKTIKTFCLYEAPQSDVLDCCSDVTLCASTAGWNDGSISEGDVNDLGNL